MPITVSITRDESELLKAAEIDGVEGGIFTFAPSDSMKIIEVVAQRSEADAPGRQRLSDRLATLYGQHLHRARKRASEQPLPLFDSQPNDTPDGEPVPVLIEQVTKPKRTRRG